MAPPRPGCRPDPLSPLAGRVRACPGEGLAKAGGEGQRQGKPSPRGALSVRTDLRKAAAGLEPLAAPHPSPLPASGERESRRGLPPRRLTPCVQVRPLTLPHPAAVDPGGCGRRRLASHQQLGEERRRRQLGLRAGGAEHGVEIVGGVERVAGRPCPLLDPWPAAGCRRAPRAGFGARAAQFRRHGWGLPRYPRGGEGPGNASCAAAGAIPEGSLPFGPRPLAAAPSVGPQTPVFCQIEADLHPA
jgi:hypothetical protein